MDIEAVITTFSYIGIFGLMTLNGFISFPSSQLLYIIVGYFVYTGSLLLLPASLVGALGNTIGNIVLYEGARNGGVEYLEKFKIFREEDVRKVEILFRKKGLWFLFVGKLLPAIKVFIPIPAAMGKVHRGAFALIMFSASWIWSFIFIAIGYFFGKSTEIWKSYAVILVVIAVIVMFVFYRLLNSQEVLVELKHSDSNSFDAQKQAKKR